MTSGSGIMLWIMGRTGVAGTPFASLDSTSSSEGKASGAEGREEGKSYWDSGLRVHDCQRDSKGASGQYSAQEACELERLGESWALE